nr:hypothetical protein GCM10020063_082130 [Dactylosporangium thailandense]
MSAFRVLLPPTMLAAVETFLTDRGAHGVEGAGLVACIPAADGGWVGTRFVTPEQQAHRSPLGCWVEVTEIGKRQLASSLRPDERFLVRVHSHPAEAFHSAADDRNPALTFRGALSVVVPYFGLGLRRGLDACALLRLTDQGWTPAEAERRAWLRAGTEWEAGQ